MVLRSSISPQGLFCTSVFVFRVQRPEVASSSSRIGAVGQGSPGRWPRADVDPDSVMCDVRPTGVSVALSSHDESHAAWAAWGLQALQCRPGWLPISSNEDVVATVRPRK